MSYKGIIIEESLKDISVLNEMEILGTKIEQVTEEHQTPGLKQWTLDTVEIQEDQADEIAEKISKTIKKAWYADYKNDKYHYIIYPHKIFKVDRSKHEEYKKATDYGISLGIRDYQVDFDPSIKVWER